MEYWVGGTVTGALFAISALALVLTFKTSRVFNFAQGGEAFFIAYVYYELVEKAHMSPILAVPISVVGCGGLLGLFLWWSLFRHLTHAPQMVRLTATIGLQVAIVAATTVLFGNHEILQQVGIVHGNGAILHIGGVGLNGNQVWALASGLVIAVAAAVVLRSTKLGVVVRGVVDSPEMSAGLGVNPNVVSAGTWVLGTMMVALVGILLVPALGLDPTGYQTLIAASFAAAIIGRLSSLSITFIAGLGLGILQSVLVPVLPPSGILGTGLPISLPFLVMVITLVLWGWLGLAPKEPITTAQTSEAPVRLPGNGAGSWDRYVGWGVLIVLILVLPHIITSFWLGIVAGSVGLGIALVSWRVITGEAGVISLAQVSLAAIGGSVAAKIAINGHIPVSLAMLFGGIIAAAVGLILGAIVLPLGPLYAALATFGFGLFADNMLLQNDFFNKYSAGLAFGRPSIAGHSATSTTAFFFFVVILFAVIAWFLKNLRDSTRGMMLAAIRSKPGRAATIGIRVTASRLLAFAIASFIAGLGGAVYASYQGNALPDSLTTPVGLVWFAVLMLSGIRSFGGAIFAGFGLVLIPEILTRYTNTTVNNLLPLLFGLGAIHFAKDPAGASTLMRRRMRSLALLVERAVRKQPVPAAGEAAEPEQVVAQPAAVELVTASNGSGVGSQNGDGGPVAGLDLAPPVDAGTSDNESILETDSVSVRFSGVRALSDVDFSVKAGQVLGLIGPNGAGKTTLLGVLSGIQKPEKGEVRFRGELITRASPAERADRGIARTFQVPALSEDLTVREHLVVAHRLRETTWNVWLDLIGKRRRRPTGPELDATQDLLFRLSLDEVADAYPSELPLGTQRLVEVAQSVMREPQVLLLDEPSAGLDTLETEAFGRVLESLRCETGMAIVLVEHDLQFVLGLSDQMIVLDFGTILATGTPTEIRANPEVLTAYFGAPVGAE